MYLLIGLKISRLTKSKFPFCVNNSSEAESAGISSNKLNWDKSGSSRMVSLTKFSNLVFIFSSTFGVLSILLVTSTTVFSSLLKIGRVEYEVGFTET